MPPSAGTRRSSRKRSADTRAFADENILDSSPSRVAKRRKSNATAARRSRRPATPEAESADDSDSNDDAGGVAEYQTLADKVIPHLHVAKAPINAATEHANIVGDQMVVAYAKFCGRDWTYYIKTLNVVIGRPPDAIPRHSSSLPADSSPVLGDHSRQIHIDLGPSKMVSRFHAELMYKDGEDNWHIQVEGRNGVRLNDRLLRRGEGFSLRCGDVLEIAGTQMIFITAKGEANIHPKYLALIGMAPNDDESIRAKTHSHAHPVTSYAPARSSSEARNDAAAVTPSQSSRSAAIAPAPPHFVRAATPTLSPKKKQQHTSSITKESPVFKRGYVIESSEQIDFTSDATKDLKPTIPYAVMITQAILSTPEQHMALNKIYKFIMENFAYYRHLKTNWQNSIRHNLSLNAGFEKVPRSINEPGKGMKWRLVEAKRSEMIQAVAKHMKKSNARPPSIPASPALTMAGRTESRLSPAPVQEFSSETNGVTKTSPPTAPSPPLTAYPAAQAESYTPTRGSRNPPLANHDHPQNLHVLSDDFSPLPFRSNKLRAGATDSSPILTSSYLEGSMLTPAPRQYNLNRLQPNTDKLPTSYMMLSSPAPFWKLGADSTLGSTPMRFPEVSPIKAGPNNVLQSSSPPPAAMANGGIFNESPTRGRGVLSFPPSTTNGENVEDGDEGAIDLVKYAPARVAIR